jgi:hypothetical protein
MALDRAHDRILPRLPLPNQLSEFSHAPVSFSQEVEILIQSSEHNVLQ